MHVQKCQAGLNSKTRPCILLDRCYYSSSIGIIIIINFIIIFIIIIIIIIRITILKDFGIFKAQTGYNRIGDQLVKSESLGCPKKRRETSLTQQKKVPLTNQSLENNTAPGDAGTKQYRDKTLSMRCVSVITIVLFFF